MKHKVFDDLPEANTKVLLFGDNSMQEIGIRFERIRSLPSDTPIYRRLLRILILLNIIKKKWTKQYAVVNEEIACIRQGVESSNVDLFPTITSFIPIPEIEMLYRELSFPLICVPFSQQMPNKLQYFLAYVPFSEETMLGAIDSQVQDVFERVFLLRDHLVMDSVNMLKKSLMRDTTFNEINIFIRAICAKLTEQFGLSYSESQILSMCVSRYIYPIVYIEKPSFFPNRVSLRKESDIRTPSIEPYIFRRAVSLINSTILYITPVDIIQVMFMASTMIVDGTLVKHSSNTSAEFGAQELLPMLEAIVMCSDSALLLATFEWLDAFCLAAKFSATGSYVVTSFLTVAQYALRYSDQMDNSDDVTDPN